jgi:hypothetical protein
METMTAEEAVQIKARIGDALTALEAAGLHNAAELKASDPARYTDEKLQYMHESSVRNRDRVFDREVANSRHNDMLRVCERFLTDPTITAPQDIRAIYEAVRSVTEGSASDAVTREHFDNAADFERLLFRFTNEDYDEAFGKEDRLETGRFINVLRSVYITADADARAFLNENLIETGRVCREANIRDVEAVRSHVCRLVLAKKSGITPSLFDGTL